LYPNADTDVELVLKLGYPRKLTNAVDGYNDILYGTKLSVNVIN